MKKYFVRFNAVQLLTIGFATLIILGGVLLSLPISSRGDPIPFFNALFTSASASCVTGLVIYDTYTQFTFFGQLVILLLIQIGGLGFMTVSIFLSFLLGRKIGLYERSLLMDTLGALKIGGIVLMAKRTLLFTAILEGLGAILLSFWFCPRFGFLQGIWMGLFHSVSAFCNAGFDLLGIVAPGTSLMTAADQVLVNVVIMVLIVSGGLGFLVWDDFFVHKFMFKKYRLHTKIVLSTTVILLVLGTILFFILESDNAFAQYGVGQQWLMAAFQSVTPRTAGFNTVDLTTLSESSVFLTMILMFIGAGSGSTGGGIKVSTVAVWVLMIATLSGRKEYLHAFKRRIDNKMIAKAFSTSAMYLMIGIFGCFIITLQGFSIKESLFESLSALGTVGLTLGITSSLPLLSKFMIIVLMFVGRVGSMSVAMAMTKESPQPRIRHLTENILIG